MSAATEAALGDLHKQVAEALTEQVQGYEEPVLDNEGKVVAKRIVKASPAILGAAITFLKNNNITASPSENAELSALAKKLAERRKRGGIDQKALEEAASNYVAANGGLPLQ